MKPLTKEQLRDNAAAFQAFVDGKRIQFNSFLYGATTNIWVDTYDLNRIHDIWHRPKPQPVSRPWSKPEDVPLNCWLRSPKYAAIHLVTQLSNDGTWGHTLGRVLWSELNKDKYEYSTDRVTWKPCTVEEQQ